MNNDFLESAVVTGKKVLRKAGQAACDFAETTRIKLQIAEYKSQISQRYRRLGRLACNTMDEGSLTMGEEMQRIYNEINDLKQSVAALKEEL
ncbi:MAG: hypothetical protein IIY12_05985 [Clostridia bacterium]|nr:hypothetical protein [Clostridia bacterium]MBQ1966036.1 hypothetical protein [Clostridia bacterium]MBQ5742890.1 hypothetical protein [Clostridia bacterium]